MSRSSRVPWGDLSRLTVKRGPGKNGLAVKAPKAEAASKPPEVMRRKGRPILGRLLIEAAEGLAP